MSDIYKKLIDIQSRLRVGKDRKNEFGDYSFRNAEDILGAARPLLEEHELCIVFDTSYEIVSFNEHQVIMRTVTAILTDGTEEVTAKSTVRETEARPKMSPEQLGGSAESYAKKYALQDLFAISDSSDDPDEPNALQSSRKALIDVLIEVHGDGYKKAMKVLSERDDFEKSAKYYLKAASEALDGRR